MDIDFKKILKKIIPFRERDGRKNPINPHREWLIIFVTFTVLVIAVALGSAFMFVQIQQDELFTTEGSVEKKTSKFDTKKLNDTIEQFKQKEIILEKLRAERPQIIDPSQ